jgi:hypothetical protein
MHTYNFGPLDRQGVLIGLRLPQLLILVGGGMAGLFMGLATGFPGGIVVMGLMLAAAVLFTMVPVQGLTLESWAPIVLAFAVQRATGENEYRSDAPLQGSAGPGGKAPKVTLPKPIQDIEFLEAEVEPGKPALMGVVKDRLRNTYLAVLAVRGRAFYLLEEEEQERMLAGWGDVISSLAHSGSAVTRLQWVERTYPEAGNSIGAYLKEAIRLNPGHRAVQSYLELAGDAAPRTLEHESFLVVELAASKARRQIRQVGGKDRDKGACAVLARTLGFVADRLEGIGVIGLEVVGVLPPRLLAKVFVDAFDPDGRARRDRRGQRFPDDEGVEPANPWPAATRTSWSSFGCDSAVSATFWVREWPLRPVGPDFLAPLLLGTRSRRTVSVVMEPVPAAQAERQAVARQTEHATNAEIREKLGFLTSARTKREEDQAERRDQELSLGHADVRFSAYVTVGADSDADLEEACGEVEMAAHECRLDLLRLYGQQDTAFTFTLPLCRGLS